MSRILGLDPGEVRVGVALSDPSGTIASPHGSLDVRQVDVVEAVRDLAAEHGVTTVVIGLPLRLDGGEGPAAARSRALGDAIADDAGLDVEYWDERFTTVTAEQVLLAGNVRRSKRKTARDPMAAAVMLQGYLDRRSHDMQAGDGGHRHDPDH